MLLIYMLCLTIFVSTVLKRKAEVYPVSVLFMVGTVYMLNEVLSIGNRLNKASLMIAYGCLIFILLILIVWQKKQGRLYYPDITVWKQKEKWEKILTAALGVFLQSGL